VTVVVDASVALKWVFQEDRSHAALALWDAWEESGERLVAPPLFRAEVANVAFQRVRRKEITLLDAVEATDTLLSIVRVEEPDRLYRRALDLAASYSLGAVYDSLYLALADIHGCPLWTADRPFAKAVQPYVPSVHWIGEAE
jgi:predicted nucleic acid-binding protein